MEPKLINRYRFDADTLRASYRQVMGPTRLLQLGIAALILAAAVRYTVLYGSLFSESVTLILMVLFLYLLAFFEAFRALTAVNRAVKNSLKRMEAAKGVTAYDVTLRFEDTEIVSESELSAEPQRQSYANIKKLRRGKTLIQLRTRSRLVYTLDPSRFENGTEEDFWRLMKEKCPQAVPKSRK